MRRGFGRGSMGGVIISHRYKFIFIKTHKTAGSSMEMALGPLCGPEDIITSMETNEHTGIPRNYHEDTLIGRAYARSRLVRKALDRRSPLLGAWYWEHMPAARVRELVGEATWRSYYKFCFERNPWDKVASYYRWKKHGQGRAMPAFRDYVLGKPHRLPRDGDLYFDGSACLMDEVHDYADFHATFGRVCSTLGIPFDGNMPREKTGIARVSDDFRECYDAETRARVAECFAREIEWMGYRFEDAQARQRATTSLNPTPGMRTISG